MARSYRKAIESIAQFAARAAGTLKRIERSVCLKLGENGVCRRRGGCTSCFRLVRVPRCDGRELSELSLSGQDG